jgi:hypothetical protein
MILNHPSQALALITIHQQYLLDTLVLAISLVDGLVEGSRLVNQWQTHLYGPTGLVLLTVFSHSAADVLI